ncbi:MAG: putative DNA binding domain-containing protein [Chloroflexi bacterium]|nr:putative DNA binding domain-containing protein [Chloroflexota bacterium]
MDLHLHTPASVDYKQPNISYLDLLRKAEQKNLDVMAFTDHNSVRGYARMLEEIENLELLERLKRLRDDERVALDEFRRLRKKILILPGFEFTATLGFHVLGIFPPETNVRDLEHLLLSLRVPSDKLDQGSGEVGATSDVLTAYRTINAAGGLVIAAHANSSHGVAMPGFDFGGQTRIAYTQDASLHALEVTDLDSKSRRRTAAFFSGVKPEYPRRMHCIQGSDAHKLDFDSKYKNEMGLGDRPTEMLLDDISFASIKQVLSGNDFSRTRPARSTAEEPFDPLREAREQGNSLVQAFHDHFGDKRGIQREILQDVVALANTNGGNLYVGVSENVRTAVAGVDRPEQSTTELRAAITRQITPPLEVQVDVLKSQGKNVLQVIVPRGSEAPYALDDAYIYVRSENETNLAVRDELIQLVRDAIALGTLTTHAPVPAAESAPEQVAPKVKPPRTGVEITAVEVKKSTKYYALRDLRNARIVTNVTRASARKLWQYAIEEHEKSPVKPTQVKWMGDIGIWKQHKHSGKTRYDLVQRAGAKIFAYYGVTEDGIHSEWRALISGEEIPAVEVVAEMPASGMPIEELRPPESLVEMEMPVDTSIALPEPRVEIAPEMPAVIEVEPETAEEIPTVMNEVDAEIPEETPAMSEPVVEQTPSEMPARVEPPAQPKSRAEIWRAELERAMEEARAAQEKRNTTGS